MHGAEGDAKSYIEIAATCVIYPFDGLQSEFRNEHELYETKFIIFIFREKFLLKRNNWDGEGWKSNFQKFIES